MGAENVQDFDLATEKLRDVAEKVKKGKMNPPPKWDWEAKKGRMEEDKLLTQLGLVW